MKSLSAYNRPRTVGDLLNTIAESLDRDGWEIEPGSVDTCGLSLSVEGTVYRLRFDEESRIYPTQEAYEGNDYSGAFIGDSDPAGFNGQETDQPF
jgi:hypothetical protein